MHSILSSLTNNFCPSQASKPHYSHDVSAQVPNTVLTRINEIHEELSQTRLVISDLRENARLALTASCKQNLCQDRELLKMMITENEEVLWGLNQQLKQQIQPYTNSIFHSRHPEIDGNLVAVRCLKKSQQKLNIALQSSERWSKNYVRYLTPEEANTLRAKIAGASGFIKNMDHIFSISDSNAIEEELKTLMNAAETLTTMDNCSVRARLKHPAEKSIPLIHHSLMQINAIVDRKHTTLLSSLRFLDLTKEHECRLLHTQILQNALDHNERTEVYAPTPIHPESTAPIEAVSDVPIQALAVLCPERNHNK